MSSLWRIELLGRFRITPGEASLGSGAPITRFQTRKTALLLAYLTYHNRRPHPREALIEMLWPESEPSAGRNSLSKALSSLRHQLEPPGVSAGSVCLADRNSVQLNPVACVTDVAEFEARLDGAARAGTTAERRQWLADAITLYEGELLPGYHEEWILPERQRLADRFHAALAELITDREESGDLPDALQLARRAVSADPLREEGHRELIRLLHVAGQPQAAQQQYEELRRLLERELGEEPAAETQVLLASLACAVRRARCAVKADAASPQPEPLAAGPAAHRAPRTAHAPQALPTGTVTFLLTDIEGSTSLWERTGEAFTTALASHHAILRRQFRHEGGRVVKTLGDGFQVAFASASDAAAAAVAGQRALAAHTWPEEVGTLRVRMALHTGDVQPEKGDSHSLVLNVATRLLTAAHGGQILCSEVTAALLRPGLEAGVPLTDLGIYRLRDMRTPQRIFQVEYPEMATRKFPPPRAEAGSLGHLPLQFTRFFGRQEEMRRLQDLLLAPETRLVTLLGPGGIGKTRLALAAAEEFQAASQAAIAFVPLADLTDPRRIAERLLNSLRLPRIAGIEPLEQAVTFLSATASGTQPVLLLLDNLEHLIDDGAALVQRLLQRVPVLRVLVTSRQALCLPVEREFPVSPLPVPEVPALRTLLQYPSVQLFVDRARAVRPDFQVTEANVAAVAALCERLEGIPLAIELAAARAGVRTPAQMVAHLESRFDFLATRQRGVEERHRTLRAAIDWSYRLLSPGLQRLFCQFCVFQGGWTLEAAQAVCDAPRVLEALEQLRECSLVQVRDVESEMRYDLLETLREFGLDELTPQMRQQLARRHAEYFARLAEQTDTQMRGPHQRAWWDRLEREIENLRTALAWSLSSAEGRELGVRLAGAPGLFWHRRGYWSEGEQWLNSALARADGGPDEPTRREIAARAHALRGLAHFRHNRGDRNQARALLEESRVFWERAGDKRGLAQTLGHLGILMEGDYLRARSILERSMALAAEVGDRWQQAFSLNNVGEVELSVGHYAAARAALEESVARFRELEDPCGPALPLCRLGELARRERDFATARARFEEALTLYRLPGVMSGLCACLDNLGIIAVDRGDYTEARRVFTEMLQIWREVGNRLGAGQALGRMAWVAVEAGELTAARAYAEESLAIRRELGDRSGCADILNTLGSIAFYAGDYVSARALHEEGLAWIRPMGDRRRQVFLCYGLARTLRAQGEYDLTRALYQESVSLARESEDRDGVAAGLDGLACLAAAEGQSQRAARLAGAATALREAGGFPRETAKRPDYDRAIAASRAALGEEAFDAAWAAGAALPWEEVVVEALGEALTDRSSP